MLSAPTAPWTPCPPASHLLRPEPRRSTRPGGGRRFRTARLATTSARWCPGHRQPLDAVNERRLQPVWFFGRSDVGNLSVKFLERQRDLAAGQVGAQAEMRAAAAEPDMRVG